MLCTGFGITGLLDWSTVKFPPDASQKEAADELVRGLARSRTEQDSDAAAPFESPWRSGLPTIQANRSSLCCR